MSRKSNPFTTWEARKQYARDYVAELPYIAAAAVATPIVLFGCAWLAWWTAQWWPDFGQMAWDASGWVGDQVNGLL